MAPEVVTDTAEIRKPALMLFSALEPAAMVSGVVVKSPISCPDARRQITVPKSMITQLDSRVSRKIFHTLHFTGTEVITDQRAHSLDDSVGREIQEGLQFIINAKDHHIAVRVSGQHGVQKRDQERWQCQVQDRWNTDGIQAQIRFFACFQGFGRYMYRNSLQDIKDHINRNGEHLADASSQSCAPDTQLRKKPIPQIRNGSRMMLLVHPTSRAIIDTFIRPTAWKSFSKKRLMEITVENRKTMVEYSSPIRITVSSWVYI